jgi:peroxiredoxin family protein
MEVSILFTYGALKRLIKGRTDRLFDDLDIDQDVRAGVEAGRIKPISEVLKDAKESGLQVYACSAAMAAYGVRQEDLIEEVDGVASLFTVIDQAREGAVTLYI